MHILQRYEWPGNIRELANLIERLLVITPFYRIEPKHLPGLAGDSIFKNEGSVNNGAANEAHSGNLSADFVGICETGEMGLQSLVEEFERQLIESAYNKFGSSYEVAKVLKISQSTAIRKAYKYGIRLKAEEV
jgi:DNA-binding NtrC family response regulator